MTQKDVYWKMLVSWSRPKMSFRNMSIEEHMQQINWQQLFNLAKENKVQFFLWRNLIQVPGYKNYALEALENEIAYRDKLLQSLIEIVNLLEKEGIRFILIKTLGPFGQLGHDIDLLIIRGENEVRKIVCALNKLKYNIQLTDVTKYTCLKRDRTVEIDLYPAINWWGLKYLDNDRIWDRRKKTKIKNSVINIPSSEDEILITCAKTFKEGFCLNDLFTMQSLLVNNTDFGYMHRQAKIHHWPLFFLCSLSVINLLNNNLFGGSLFQENLSRTPYILKPILALLRYDITKRKFKLPYRLPILLLLSMWIHMILMQIADKHIRNAAKDLRLLVVQVGQNLPRLLFKSLQRSNIK
jgi:hypothetical protein